MPIVLPTTLVANENEDVNDLNSILAAIVAWSDGNIATDDLEDSIITAAKLGSNAVTTAKILDANVTDAKLASPNNATYKHVLAQGTVMRDALAAGTYILGTRGSANPYASGADMGATGVANYFMPIYFDDADRTVSGKTQVLRLRAQVLANSVAPAITFTFGLYPITVAGAGNTLTVTLGTVVSGSQVAIASPSASTVTSAVSSDITIPSDGEYALGVVTSGSLAATCVAALSAQLQVRHT